MITLPVTKIFQFNGHKDCVYALQPTGDGKSFFSAGGDGMVVQWTLDHPDQGQLVARVPHPIYSLCAIPSESLLIVGQNNEGIHVLDQQTRKEISTAKCGFNRIFDIQYFQGILFVGLEDGTLVVFDLKTGSVTKRISASNKSLRSIAINPITGEIAAGYSDCFIRIFSLENQQLKLEWKGHENSVFTLSYDNNFTHLISAGRDAKIKRWNVDHHYAIEKEVAAHLHTINHVLFSPNGKHFLTCSLDKSIKIWQSEDMKLLKVIDKTRHAGHGTSVNRLLWIDPCTFASASDDQSIAVWKMNLL